MAETFHREPAILRRKQVESRTGLARSTIYREGPDFWLVF
jgi:predicted DNA-binding transcriptional regulator AlpA